MLVLLVGTKNFPVKLPVWLVLTDAGFVATTIPAKVAVIFEEAAKPLPLIVTSSSTGPDVGLIVIRCLVVNTPVLLLLLASTAFRLWLPLLLSGTIMAVSVKLPFWLVVAVATLELSK